MKILVAVLAAVIVVLAGALAWLGAFATVKIEEREMGPYPFAYVQEAGTDLARIEELTEALGARLDAAGFVRRRPAQVFYPQGRGIQNQVGFVVDRPVGLDVLGTDTFFRPIPVQRYMVARFPYRTPMSSMIGRFRVEPALREHRAGKDYAETSVMVILEGDTLLYLQPIAPA